jgi:hypothetical protein
VQIVVDIINVSRHAAHLKRQHWRGFPTFIGRKAASNGDLDKC